MEKKLVLNELNRIREMMGLTIISENNFKKILNEGVGSKGLDLLGIGAKTIDNLEKAGIKYEDDLSQLSKEFETVLGKANPNMDDLIGFVATKAGKTIDEITDAEIIAFIKGNETLYGKILEAATQQAKKIVDEIIAKTEISTIFAEKPDELAAIQKLIEEAPNKYTVDTSIGDIQNKINNLTETIKDIEADGSTVPTDLLELQAQLQNKLDELTEFKKGPLIEPIKPIEDDIVDDITDEEAEEIVINPQSKIDEIFNAILGNKKLREKAGIRREDVGEIYKAISQKYGNLTLEQLEKNLDTLKQDIQTLIGKAKKEIEDAEIALQKEKDTKKAARLEMWIKWKKKGVELWESLSNNKVTRWCLGKNKLGDVDPSVWTTIKCGARLYVMAELIVHFSTPPMDRQPFANIPCSLISVAGLCSTFYTKWGVCSKKCTGEGEDVIPDVLERTYDDKLGEKIETDRGFQAWALINKKQEPYGQDNNGYFYTENGNKVYMVFKDGNFEPKNNVITGKSYTNDASGYAAYVADVHPGKVYGPTGDYVFQDGKPFYKDAAGSWQLGSHNGTTFITN